MSTFWTPSLTPGTEPLYEKIVVGLEGDMRSGVLVPGVRLPPQRDLAFALKVSTGTVTRAYVEAERRGLIHGHVGRGTFVSDLHVRGASAEESADRTIDLSVNIIPHGAAARRLASSTKRRADLAECLAYAPPLGAEAHRRSATTWLDRTANFAPPWSRIAVTGGAQHAMALAFNELIRPSDTVLCEVATFSGVKSLSEHLGFCLQGVAMDEEGLEPEALSKAIKTSGAKVLYAMPTVQNPTGRTMSRRRRGEVAEVLKRTGVWLIEDDNYAIFRPRSHATLSPLAEALPEQSFYIGGASKSLAPGLRTGFLVCPPASTDAIARAIRATVYAPSTLGPELFSRWVDDGSAFTIVDEVVQEIHTRGALARDTLGLPASTPEAPHVWLAMSELDAERTFSRALRAGVAVTPGDAPTVSGDPVCGLRVCLGAPASTGLLEVGLRRLASALAPADRELLSV